MIHTTDNPTVSVELYLPSHGTYNTMIADFDRAMAYFANATDNDIMCDLIEGQGYEIDYSDINSRFGLIVAWCDNHGFSERGMDEDDRKRTWAYYKDAPAQSTWARQTRHVEERMAEIWTSQSFWVGDVEQEYSGVKQDKSGKVYRVCCNRQWMMLPVVQCMNLPYEHFHEWEDKSRTWPHDDCMLAYCPECGHIAHLSIDRISGYVTSR